MSNWRKIKTHILDKRKNMNLNDTMKKVLLKSLLVIYYIQCMSAQLSTVEEMRNMTGCDVDDVTIDCGSSVIAVDSIVYRYDVACETTCCDLNADHCPDNAAESEMIYAKRDCSGKSTCTVNLAGSRAFCSLGTHEPSYVTIYYYCIPADRTSTICSSSTLQSPGLPLYLTSKDYPGVTTGNSTCSCSIEVFNCTSSVYIYILDADLYLDTSTCEQTIDIRDSLNNILHEVKCESYYTSDITTHTLNKHYITINFNDNSNANQEGLFFLGFSASSRSSQFDLRCSSVPEIRCVDCGSSFDIENGNASLSIENDSSNGATATVECDEGYNTSISTIKCLDSGTWEESTCTEVKVGGVNTDKTGPDTSPSKDDDGELADWIIVIIVIAVIVAVIVVLIDVWCCLKSDKCKTSSKEGDIDEIKRHSDTLSPPATYVRNGFKSRSPLPAIPTAAPAVTPQHEIQHGHVYIDHNEAHIFGLTVHIPFRKNKVEPVNRQQQTEDQDVEDKHQDREVKDLDRGDKDLDREVKDKHEEVKHQGGMPEDHRDDMILGISAGLNDSNVYIAPGPGKNRLPPIKQHHKEQNHDDHHHHHFPTEVEEKRKRLQPKLEEARKQGHRAELFRDSLLIDNFPYNSETLKHEEVSQHTYTSHIHAP